MYMEQTQDGCRGVKHMTKDELIQEYAFARGLENLSPDDIIGAHYDEDNDEDGPGPEVDLGANDEEAFWEASGDVDDVLGKLDWCTGADGIYGTRNRFGKPYIVVQCDNKTPNPNDRALVDQLRQRVNYPIFLNGVNVPADWNEQ